MAYVLEDSHTGLFFADRKPWDKYQKDKWVPATGAVRLWKRSCDIKNSLVQSEVQKVVDIRNKQRYNVCKVIVSIDSREPLDLFMEKK